MHSSGKKGHLVVLGCGDVGRRVVETLRYTGIMFTVVDSAAHCFENVDYDYVVGNATEEEVLIQADVAQASTIIITLNDDTYVMFATLITRGLNPGSTIIARANSYRSIDKIYKAGADYVAALPIVAGQMLAKMTSRCIDVSCKKMDEDIMLYEGIEIEKYTVTGWNELANRTIADIGMRKKIGCTIIGIEREGNVITDILPSTKILKGDIIAIVGGKEEMKNFKEKYVK